MKEIRDRSVMFIHILKAREYVYIEFCYYSKEVVRKACQNGSFPIAFFHPEQKIEDLRFVIGYVFCFMSHITCDLVTYGTI